MRSGLRFKLIETLADLEQKLPHGFVTLRSVDEMFSDTRLGFIWQLTLKLTRGKCLPEAAHVCLDLPGLFDDVFEKEVPVLSGTVQLKCQPHSADEHGHDRQNVAAVCLH